MLSGSLPLCTLKIASRRSKRFKIRSITSPTGHLVFFKDKKKSTKPKEYHPRRTRLSFCLPFVASTKITWTIEVRTSRSRTGVRTLVFLSQRVFFACIVFFTAFGDNTFVPTTPCCYGIVVATRKINTLLPSSSARARKASSQGESMNQCMAFRLKLHANAEQGG